MPNKVNKKYSLEDRTVGITDGNDAFLPKRFERL
jgi:hypothetical protein